MAYTVPTLDQFHTFLIQLWKGFFPASNVATRYSYHWKRLRALAGAVTDLHAHINSAQNDVMPDTSLGSFLTRWGTILGVAKKGATGARGTKSMRVFGTVGATVTTGDQLRHDPTGFTFQSLTTTTVGAAGYVDVDVAAISTGAATRLLAGENLTFIAPGVGITAVAKVVIALTTEGYDVEQDPAYSVRVNNELGQPRMGGHQNDFVKWALTVSGISSAYAYPNRAGIGTVDVAAFHAGTGTARALTLTERGTLLAYLQTVVPAQLGTVYSALRILVTATVPTPVEITVTANGDPAYAFDWDDTTPPTVLTYTAATRTVVFSTSLGGDVLAAKRIVFRGVASLQDGTVYTIDTVSTTTLASDTITIREVVAVNLAATDIGYAGGPLTKIIRDAIVAHLNGEIVYADKGQPIGASAAATNGLSISRLRVLAEALGPANPGGIYGTWNGDLLRAVLAKIAMFPTGARNINVVIPVADVPTADNAFPADTSTNFIVPSAVLIHRG